MPRDASPSGNTTRVVYDRFSFSIESMKKFSISIEMLFHHRFNLLAMTGTCHR
jgi:hypothetical protein